jgi:hypothetical protein
MELRLLVPCLNVGIGRDHGTGVEDEVEDGVGPVAIRASKF